MQADLQSFAEPPIRIELMTYALRGLFAHAQQPPICRLTCSDVSHRLLLKPLLSGPRVAFLWPDHGRQRG